MTTEKRGDWERWGIFNLVGVLGFAVQLGTLVCLKRFFGLNLVPATAIAVEIALLHNFVWHEHVTWADVISPFQHGMFGRIARFHLANGLISIAGNVSITWLLVRLAHLPYWAANALSVLACSIGNFFVGDRLVFRQESSGTRASKDSLCPNVQC